MDLNDQPESIQHKMTFAEAMTGDQQTNRSTLSVQLRNEHDNIWPPLESLHNTLRVVKRARFSINDIIRKNILNKGESLS